jgi:hypothetical protein
MQQIDIIGSLLLRNIGDATAIVGESLGWLILIFYNGVDDIYLVGVTLGFR